MRSTPRAVLTPSISPSRPASTVLAPPGTPITPRRKALLFQQELEGRNILAQHVAAGEDFQPIADDNWEEASLSEIEDAIDEDPFNQSMLNGPQPRPVEPTASLGRTLGESSSASRMLQEFVESPDTILIPQARGVPHSIIEENTPDPFYIEHTSHARQSDWTDIHPDQGVYMLYMLIIWLHQQFHLPVRACNVALAIFVLVASAFGKHSDPPLLTTLSGISSAMGTEPTIRVLPVCPQCLEVHPDDVASTVCTKCSSFLFKAIPAGSTSRNDRVPALQFPYKDITSQLADMLAVPGVEAEMDKWRHVQRKDGEYEDVFDGRICQELRGPDGKLFFANTSAERDQGPNGELRVGVILGADWYGFLNLSRLCSCADNLHVYKGSHIFAAKLPLLIRPPPCHSVLLICHHIFGTFISLSA